MTEKEYRALDGISRSELWRLRESPEKFKWFQEHPEPPTPALTFGAAAHKLLLDPNTFNDEFAVLPECDRRTKAGKEQYNAFLEENDGKGILSLADYEKAQKMAEKAMCEPLVRKLLEGKREEPFFWVDDLTGETCKIRVDVILELGGRPIVVDYKTTMDASTDAFMRSAINYGYDFQAAMYAEGIKQTIGQQAIFVFIAQEKTEPYAVNIMQANEEMMQRGYDIFRELIGVYHECKTTGNWYGYLGELNAINSLGLPAWMVKEEVECN